MKRKILSVLLVFILCLGLAITAYGASEIDFLVDDAQLLSESERAELAGQLARISARHNAQIVIVTLAATEGGDIDTYVEHYYDSMGLGYGADHDGVLLMLSMDLREYRILSNGMAAHAITTRDIDSIGNAIVSDLSDGNYADAFQSFADECDYYLNGYLNGFPFHFGQKLAISLIVGILIGLVVVLILKGQLKSVRKQSRAHAYVVPGSMDVTVRRDLFLYRNVTRRKKESSSSSGSRGSSRNVGGGRF